jgi:cytochrome c556
MTIPPTITRLLALASLCAAACGRSAAAPAPSAAPASLDARTPVPLTAMMAQHQKQEMRDHLRAIQEITAALATDDFDGVAKAASRIGWSEQQAAMCKHMGAGAPGFAAVGEQFHKTADGIAAAAQQRDRAAVIAAVGATLERCVGCHDTYRQEIVDDAAFAKLGGGSGGMGAMGAECPMMQGH